MAASLSSFPAASVVAKRSVLRTARNSRLLPYEDAKVYIRSRGHLKFRSSRQYREWANICRGNKPAELPARPDLVYADKGWKGYPDFCGYEPSKYDRLRAGVHDATLSADTVQPTSLRKRGQTVADVLEKLGASAPEFEARRLSARWPSVLLVRQRRCKTSPSAKNPAPAVDEWIALQLKFSREDSAWAVRHASDGTAFYRITLRVRDNVGFLFVSEGGEKVAFKRAADVGPLRGARRAPWTTIHLEDFDPKVAAFFLNHWWETCPRNTAHGWVANFPATGADHLYHEKVTAEVERKLYSPLNLAVDHIFPLESCMQGNLVVGGLKCLQKTGRWCRGGRGWCFDVNKVWNNGRARRGPGWRGSIERYICVIAQRGETNPKCEAHAVVRGVFIFPRDQVWPQKGGMEQPKQKGRMQVYPPFVIPLGKRAVEKQAVQLQFYVDFEKMTTEEQLAKAKELLRVPL